MDHVIYLRVLISVVLRDLIFKVILLKAAEWHFNGKVSYVLGLRDDAVGWGTALQAGSLLVRFPMVSFEFFIDIILPASPWPWGDSAPNRNEYQEYFLGDKGGRCVRLTTLPPSCADFPWNLGASTIWNPQGLSRPVMGLVCILSYFYLTLGGKTGVV